MHSPGRLAIPSDTVIEVCYDGKSPLTNALRRGHFACKKIEIPLKSVPVSGNGTVRYSISEGSFYGEAPAHVVIHWVVMTGGLGFADPLTALEAGRLFLRHRRFGDYVTLFALPDRGQMCELVMGDFDGGFGVEIRRIELDRIYGTDVSFLTVRRATP